MRGEEWNSSPLVQSHRAEAYYENGERDNALVDANNALCKNSNSAKALVVKAKCHNARQEYKEAFKAISKAQSIDYDPDLNDFVHSVKSKSMSIKSPQDKNAPSASSSPSGPNVMDMLNDPNMIALAQNMLQTNPEMIQSCIKSMGKDSNMKEMIQSMMHQ